MQVTMNRNSNRDLIYKNFKTLQSVKSQKFVPNNDPLKELLAVLRGLYVGLKFNEVFPQNY